MLSTSEHPTPIYPSVNAAEQIVEEIRAICRLHALPTGDWRNLGDLPRRLAHDTGLRTDFTAIVRTLQGSGIHLPDALDLMSTAIGGATASQHTRELSESLNTLGSFLANTGRWPDTDSRPILAPGEVPANIEQFSRPQPRVRPIAEAPLPHSFPEPGSDPEPDAYPVSPTTLAEQSPTPSHSSSDRPRDLRDDRSPQPLRRPTPAPFNNPPPSSSSSSSGGFDSINEIVRALSRLELGNLELRAHLDSIDQRISRMEPLLELGAPPAPSAPPPAQLIPRNFSRRPIPSLRADTPDPGLHSDPITTGHLQAEPLSVDPIHAPSRDVVSPEAPPLPSQPSRASLHPEAATHLTPKLHSVPQSTDRSAPEDHPARLPRTTATVSRTRSVAPVPHEVVPRFSHLLRDDHDTFPASQPLDLSAAAAATPAVVPHDPNQLRPGALPRGFFGTLPEPGPADAFQAHAEPDPTPSRRRGLVIVLVVVLLLLALAAAGFVYLRTQNAVPETGFTPASITPPQYGSGPLTSTPSVASAPTGNAGTPGSPKDRVLDARSSFQPRASAQDLHTSKGFRPAGTFVPATIMDGRLLSAPMPDKPRVSSNSGLKGMVVMEVNISRSGQVEDINVLGGNRALQSAAIAAVRTWHYRPYTVNGAPKEVRTIVRVDFNQHRPEMAERGAPFPP